MTLVPLAIALTNVCASVLLPAAPTFKLIVVLPPLDTTFVIKKLCPKLVSVLYGLASFPPPAWAQLYVIAPSAKAILSELATGATAGSGMVTVIAPVVGTYVDPVGVVCNTFPSDQLRIA